MSNKLDILITADNRQARAAFKQTEGDLKDLEQSSKQSGINFRALGAAAAGAGAAMAALKIGQIAFDLAKGADEALRVEQAYRNLAKGVGASADDMIAAMTKMSQGSISSTDLMLAANKAMLLGVADSATEMTALMEVAIERGAAMGLSANQAFSDIVTGLGRMSPQILDNLGIKVSPQVFDDYAASIGKTVDALTDAEKKQALYNAVTAETDGELDVTISKFAEYSAQIENLKDSLGALVLPEVLAGLTAVNSLLDQLQQRISEVDAHEALLISAEDARNVQAYVDDIEALKQEMAQMYPDSAGYANAMRELEQLTQYLTMAQQEYRSNVEGASAAQYGQAEAFNATSIEAEAYLKKMGQVQTQSSAMGWDMLGASLNIPGQSSIVDGTDALGITNIAEHAKMAQERTRELREEMAALHREADRAALTLAEDAFGAGGAEAAKQAFSDMRSEIRGQVDAWQEAGYPVELITNVLLPQYVSGIQAAGQATVAEMGNATGAMMEFQSAVGATIARLNAWRGQTASMLQGMSSRLVGDLGAEGAIEFYEQSTAAVEDQRRAWILAGHDVEYIDKILLPSYVGSLDDAYAKTAAIGGATTDVADGYDRLLGKVQGVLSGAIGPVSGLNAEDFLPREDEVNENARRLADIMVNGFKGQEWLDEFAAEAPDVFAALMSSSDPKGEAARLLKDFQDGLRPDLIDKGRAKELVKRALMGEAHTDALAKEIAAELSSEMSVGLEEAQKAAAEALGLDTENTMDINVVMPSNPTAEWMWPPDPMRNWSWPSPPSWVTALLSWNPFGGGGIDTGQAPGEGSGVAVGAAPTQIAPRIAGAGFGPPITINATILNDTDGERLALQVARHMRQRAVMA